MGRVAGVTAAVVLAMLMLASALPLLVPSAAAEGEIVPTYTWDGEGATNLASEAANWRQDIGGVITNDVLPTNNSHIRYDATSVKACTWDLAYPSFVAYSFTLATGYSGTVMQGDVDIGIGAGGYTQQTGTLSGNIAKSTYCAGDFIQTSGAITASVLRLVMVGDDTTLSFGVNVSPYDLNINGNVTFSGVAQLHWHDLVIADGKSFTLETSYIFRDFYSGTFTNNGIISGASAFKWQSRGVSSTVNLGVIDAPVEFYRDTGAGGSPILMLGSNTEFGSTISISSQHATNTMTVATSGHSLTANGITVGTRGAIVGDGTIINAGDLDASAGVFGVTGQYVQAGDGTIKLGVGQSLENITILSQGLATKWSMQITGTQLYTVTRLDPGKEYAYYEDEVLLGSYVPDESGNLTMTAEGDGTLIAYQLRLNPVITPVPLQSTEYTRYNVDEGVNYRVQYLSDRHVTWTISGAPFLTIDDNGVISGTPGLFDSGEYTVTVRADNGVGWSEVSFQLTVNDSLKPVTNEVGGIIGAFIGAFVLIGLMTVLLGGLRRLQF